MGVAELEEALRRQAAESASSIVDSARREVAASRAAFDAAWEEQRRTALAEVVVSVKASTGAELIAARRAARKRVLAARHRAIEQVLDAVQARLRSGIRSDVELEDLLQFLPAREADVEEAPDGLIITAKDGSVTVDATLSRKLERMRPLLAIRILEMIA
jgi:vacuolar-type H+-ATPase subunit E/Vma4